MNENAHRILDSIVAYHNKWGWWPSVRDIKADTQIPSTSTVQYHMGKLEEAGFLVRGDNQPRAMKVTKEGYEYARVERVVHET